MEICFVAPGGGLGGGGFNQTDGWMDGVSKRVPCLSRMTRGQVFYCS